jgi:hypothetical protein
MLPRIVTTTDVNFLELPHLGLASLMLEAGYVDAEAFVEQFKVFFESRSIYSFLRTYSYLTSPSVSSCLYLFSKLLGDLDSESWRETLLTFIPQYTSGFSEVYNLLQASTLDNYKVLLDWFGYSYIDVTDLIDNPFKAIHWVAAIDSSLSGLNTDLINADLSAFFVKVVLRKTGVDVTSNVEYYSLFRRWVNLAFTRYAYGADINQIRWF